MAKYKKTIVFEPGYNHLHDLARRSQHGMSIRFNLIGPNGAVQFHMNTRWTPIGPVDDDLPRDRHRDVCHVDDWTEPGMFGMRSPLIGPPRGVCIGLHSPKPFAHDPEAETCTASACDVLPGGTCYFDASYVASDKLMRKFISEGEKVVWKELKVWYRKYFEKKGYVHTHESVDDGSPAMLVSQDEHWITLVNEDGLQWTDPLTKWRPIEKE